MDEPAKKLRPAEQTTRFMELFLKHQRRIYGFILTLVPDRADADDLLQETCAFLWERFEEFEPGTNFGAWALSVARLKVLKSIEQKRYRPTPLADDLMTRIADEATRYADDADDRLDALRQCLDKLPPNDRELIRLRYNDEWRVEDVAVSIGRSASAVYKSLHRIHNLLLLCIEQAMGKGGPR